MISKKIYQIAKQLNLNKRDINNILSVKKTDIINLSSPIDVYKAGSDYGTISIKEFKQK